MKLNKNKLEKTLLSNWTSFIDIKDLIEFLNQNFDSEIKKLTFSRFELTSIGFIACIDYENQSTISSLEILIDFDGEIIILQ